MYPIKTFTEQFIPIKLPRLLKLITDFEQKKLTEQYKIIDELVTAHASLNIKWHKGSRFKRAREIASIDTISEIIWPPSSCAPSNRANSEGNPVMYMSDRLETALREIRLKTGYVVLAEFSIQPNKVCQVLPVGEMLLIQRTGRGRLLADGSVIDNIINACEREEAQSYLITDSFLHDTLVKDEYPYEISSYLCEALFKKNPSVSVISYPSIQQIGAINFAVKIDNFWDIWGIETVSKFHAVHLAQGFYKLNHRKNVLGIHSNGSLEWGETVDDARIIDLLDPLWTP